MYRLWQSVGSKRLIVTFSLLISVFGLLASCARPDGPQTIRESGTPVVAQSEAVSSPSDEPNQDAGTPTVREMTATVEVQPPVADSCAEVQGQVQRIDYSSQLLGEYVPALVYLPPCYTETQDYPVIFLLHGKPQDENHWLILGIKQVVDQKIVSGEMEALILVMPRQPEPLFSQTDGGAGSYEGDFLSALVPAVEKSYAVSALPSQRAIAGISRGGVWALEIAFTNPALFSGVAALSPSLNVNDARDLYDPLIIAQSAYDLPERIFLASGDVDSAAAATRKLHVMLRERAVAHRYTTVPGGHEGGTWQQLLEETLDYLTQDW